MFSPSFNQVVIISNRVDDTIVFTVLIATVMKGNTQNHAFYQIKNKPFLTPFSMNN